VKSVAEKQILFKIERETIARVIVKLRSDF